MSRIISLDDLYHMVANIYHEQNRHRSESKTFTHFVEVCGMLTAHARGKKRNVDFETAICKALGWFFPLMAKCKVRSLEELVFRKYPRVCPYCRKSPHIEAECKNVRGSERTVDHQALKRFQAQNRPNSPKRLGEWQAMFQDIYPRNTEDKYRSTVGLFEELGELAEAIRIYDDHPRFFAGEAADVFSYLMGLANEYNLRIQSEGQGEFDFEAAFLKRYPGICMACGNSVCSCPTIPVATIGRMSKELPIEKGDDLFRLEIEEVARRGSDTSLFILGQAGGYRGVMKELPLDRGQLNQNLILICIAASRDLEKENPALSQSLLDIAQSIGLSRTKAGEKHIENAIPGFLSTVRAALQESDQTALKKAAASDPVLGAMHKAITSYRILIVTCSPTNEKPLNAGGEANEIEESIKRSEFRDYFKIEVLNSPTVDSISRKFLAGQYDIIHFIGHSGDGKIILADSDGEGNAITLESLSSMLTNTQRPSCVIFNSCCSISNLKESIGDYTIGTLDEIFDNEAMCFSRAFYDALGSQKSIADAYIHALDRFKMSGFYASKIHLIKKK